MKGKGNLDCTQESMWRCYWGGKMVSKKSQFSRDDDTLEQRESLEFNVGDDPLSFIEVIGDHWWNPEWGIKESGVKVVHLELHTGGYSDNEQLINELQQTDFWMLYWQKTVRGGHYYFKIDTRKVKK